MANKVGTALFQPQFNSPEAGKNGELFLTYTGGANSGDTITFSGEQLAKLPAGTIIWGSQVIIPGSTASLTTSLGYAATDGDTTTTNATNATYFNSATATATAGRYRADTANAPIIIPKDAWIRWTVGGATLPSATYSVIVDIQYPGPVPANR